jgi:8-oxo-dGTP diphosphatase
MRSPVTSVIGLLLFLGLNLPRRPPMAASDYVLSLRKKVGHDLLLLPGASAMVIDDASRILLQRRSDTGQWYFIGGAVEPGETAVQAAVREALEETGLEVEPTRLVGVYTSPEVIYPNGDRCMYITTAFRCRATGGVARADGVESLELRWFRADALPEMRADARQRVLDALPERGEACAR